MPGSAHGHRRRDAGDAVEERRARVERPVAGRRERLDALARDFRDRRLELGAADEQKIDPGRTGIVVPVRVARVHEQAARGGVGERRRLGHDLLHPIVGRERLALDDADRGQRPHQLGIERSRRLLLYHVVEQFVGLKVAGRNGVERLAAAFMEDGRRRPATRPSLVFPPGTRRCWCRRRPAHTDRFWSSP